MNAALRLTASDLTRTLASIGLQHHLAKVAQRRADGIEFETELAGQPVSTTVIASDDGVSIRVTPDGDAFAFDEFSDPGDVS